MSAISTILTRLANTVALIRSAIYAIDVRDDIADAIEKCGEAIEQCYSDVSNPTLQTEALEAALQNKIDQGKMAALTIGDHTITAAKLASGVFDNTLATSGAAADAKTVGDALGEINESLGDVRDDLTTLADITPIPDNSDLNDYGETGLYSIEYSTYTIANYPPVAIAASYLEVRKLTTGYVGQKLTIPGNGKVFTRRRFNNGAWNDWIQITRLGSENGLSEDVKTALIACFANVEWAGSSPNGDSYINALKNALGMTVSKTFTYPSGGLGSTEGRLQVVSSSDRTATINTTALQTCTVGARVANADTANLALNGIYGIKQGSFTKIKYYATTTSTNSSAHFNIGYVVCKIIDGVYRVSSMASTETATAPDGIQVNLPENPNNDNYIFLKVEGINTNARTELAVLEMVLIEAPNGESPTPSTPTPTQEIVFTPDLNIMAEMSITPELIIRSNSQRQSFGAISDEPKIIAYPSLSPSNYSLIRVPSGKTTVTVTCVKSARCNMAWFDLTDTYQGNPYYHFINQTGWQTAAKAFTFDVAGKDYIAINFESTDSNSSNYTLTMS